MLCLLCPFALAQATDLPIETKLDAAIVSALDTNAMQSTLPTQTAETLPPTQDALASTEAEDGQLLWPMMPNETLAQLAKTFYPDSPILEQRFMQKAIRLTKALGVTLLSDTPFKRVQVIAIPDEKEVRAVTHRIKRLQEITHAQSQLQLSYQLKLSDQLKKIIPPPPKPGQTATQQTHVAPVIAKQTVPASSSAATISVWQQAQATVSSWAAIAKDYWVKTVPSLQLPPTMHARLSHPQWRNGLYLALLVLIGLGVWRLQKRYMRRQIALLNTITTTLEDSQADTIGSDETDKPLASVARLTPYNPHEEDEDSTSGQSAVA